MRLFLLIAALALVSAACSGEVETGRASGGAGGAKVDAGPGCGGDDGVSCADDEVCVFTPVGSCGNGLSVGTCKPRPTGCDDDCPGVCGCDGSFFCNTCEAARAGQDVNPVISCFPDAGPTATYTAFPLATGVARYVIFKADTVRDVCVRIIVEGLDSGMYAISTPPGWWVGKAEITNHASDCELVNGTPPAPKDTAVQASAASGALSDAKPPPGPFPCQVSIHATLTFPAGPSWVPATESIDADALNVGGGC